MWTRGVSKPLTYSAESGNYYDGHNYTVEIEEVFKGNLKSPVVIFSENSSGRFPMPIGNTYLIFVYYELGRHQISNCGNSGLLADRQDAVRAIQALKQDKAERK